MISIFEVTELFLIDLAENHLVEIVMLVLMFNVVGFSFFNKR